MLGPPGAPVPVRPSEAFQDGYLSWAEDGNLAVAKELELTPAWEWVGWPTGEGAAGPISGVLWGGCLEVLMNHLANRRCLPAGPSLAEALRGAVSHGRVCH